MDNIVNGSKPSIIQYTKMGRKDNVELDAEDSFFWSDEYRKFATDAYNLLNQPYYTKKDKLIAALEDKLQSLYTTAIGREQEFLYRSRPICYKASHECTQLKCKVQAHYIALDTSVLT